MMWVLMFIMTVIMALLVGGTVVLVTDVGIGALLGTSLLALLGFGLVFLMLMWGGMWLNRQRPNRRSLHENKLLRHENTTLKQMVSQQERLIATLQKQLDAQASQPPPPGSPTGAHPRIETREMTRQVGEYQVVNTPTYTPHSETGRHSPPGRTGAHPIRKTGEVRRPRPLTERDRA